MAHDARWRATVDYAFAIPTPEALDAIAARGPVVEVGAGTGYWARLLAARGCDVVAYDRVPAGKRNEYHQGQVVGRWFPVVELDAAEAAARHPDRTLLLAWPPYAEDMAFRALDAYRGATVAYVGEGDGGCTADDAFHERLSSAWTDTTYVSLPQWPGLHDALTIYERTGR